MITARRKSLSAERDVRGRVARDGVHVDLAAVGRDHDDPVADRADRDAAVGLHRQRVERVPRGHHAHAAVADGQRPRGGADLAGGVEVPRPQAPGVRLRDVDPPAVGREADAVRPEERERLLDDGAAVRRDVVEAAPVDARAAPLAVVGEPHAAGLVEDEVVGPSERPPVALAVQHRDLAGVQVDPLDPPAREPGRLAGVRGMVDRDADAVHLGPQEPAVVGDERGRGRLERHAVRPAARCRDDRRLLTSGEPQHTAAVDVDDVAPRRRR